MIAKPKSRRYDTSTPLWRMYALITRTGRKIFPSSWLTAKGKASCAHAESTRVARMAPLLDKIIDSVFETEERMVHKEKIDFNHRELSVHRIFLHPISTRLRHLSLLELLPSVVYDHDIQ